MPSQLPPPAAAMSVWRISLSLSAAAAAGLGYWALARLDRDMTLLVTPLVIYVALGVGAWVGRRRGPVAGIASGFGVLAAGALGYLALLALALPM
jgi:hypothetical protein